MKLKDLIEQYGEYEIVDETKFKTWDATLPKEKSGSIQIESREGIQIRLEPPKPKSVWDLEYGDEYVRITGTGGVSECEVCTKITYDKQRDVGNVFLTEEEAEREVERRKVETLLLKYGGRRWFKYEIANWVIRYNHLSGSFEYGYTKCTQNQSCIYFDTKEQAEKAIVQIGADRIKRALFEVR